MHLHNCCYRSVGLTCPWKTCRPPYCIIGIRLRCGLSMPRGPSCGTSAENRAPIVCGCNPTQWLRLKAAVPRGLCGQKYKQWATTKAKGKLGPWFNEVYTAVARSIKRQVNAPFLSPATQEQHGCTEKRGWGCFKQHSL